MDGIRFYLNGTKQNYEGSAADRLLDVLRDTYLMTSVKCGCKEGECGACSILLNGILVNSCCVAMGAVADCRITTLEGYRETEQFAVVSNAYAEVAAVQCGFCTPGMVMATEALLRKTPHPTETQIREGISGNLCRCTGYNAVVKAIEIAAKEGNGLW